MQKYSIKLPVEPIYLMKAITGRIAEIAILEKILNSGDAELVAMYGRRRVGKTFLIRNFYAKQIEFEFSGIHNATFSQQLENFSIALGNSFSRNLFEKPKSWQQAFQILSKYLSPILKKKRTVIFFDEFPWINTPRSGFLPAFENFWNTWASKEQNLVVVICGSAAAWMIKKIVNNRGGLHNRVSYKIRLLPFTVGETRAFLKYRKINLDSFQVLQLYMAMGGIPQYLKEIQIGESAALAIDRICFSKDGLLQNEFKNLYSSLFDQAGSHVDVVRALAKKNKGLTRKEIISICKLTTGGWATQILEELSESGFITPYIPFDKTAKDCIYKLTDEYSIFYLKFIENNRPGGIGTWVKFSTGSSYKSWSGSAFESICLKHLVHIKKALGIEMVYTEASVWRSKTEAGGKGAQIDLLIDRRDLCINVCEIKFSVNEFEITKAYADELRNKLNTFGKQTSSRKTIFLTMITTHGVIKNKNYHGLIQNEVSMKALFA